MKRILITPTFRPHFPFNREFLQSYAAHVGDAADFPVHFIATRDEADDLRAIVAEFPALDLHVHAFEDLLEASGHRDEPLALLREFGKFTYQSLKKLYALKHLPFDQALLLDSEALVLKPVRMAAVFDEYYADPFVLYSDFSNRGDAWFHGLSNAAVRNAAKLLRIPYPKMYFMEYYGWFYEKGLIQDVFAALKEDLLPAVRARLGEDPRLFENQLIYSLLLANPGRYPYRLESVNTLLLEYLGEELYADYMRHFEGGASLMGVFEMASLPLNRRNLPALVRLFSDRRFLFFRFDLRNLNEDVQRELVEQTPITFLVSSEGYRRRRERIAVCLSGVARNPRQNCRHLRHFLDELDADLFVHFWETPDADFIERALRPTAHVFESRDDAPEPPEFRRCEKFMPERRPTDSTSMFYSIKRANELKRAHEEAHGFRYDVVVRVRLDFFSARPLVEVLDRIRFEQKGWENTLYVPDMAHSMGLNDQIAMGTSETMDAYAAAFDTLPDVAKHDLFNPEYVTLRNAIEKGLRIRTFQFEYVLLRDEAVQTFDLERLVKFTRTTWWSAQLPNIYPNEQDAFFRAKRESVDRIDALDLEFAKVYRLRAGGAGYVRYDAQSRALALAPTADQATLFYVVIADDEDRTAVNIRPRELVLASVGNDEPGASAFNFVPTADGAVRPDGPAGEDAAFFVAAAGDGVSFEWRPGFWKTPAAGLGTERRPPGGFARWHTDEHKAGARLLLQAAGGRLTLAPRSDAAEPFTLEYVRDAEAEGVRAGLVRTAKEEIARNSDPLPVRLLYITFIAARLVSRRGLGAARIAAGDFLRKQAHEAERTNATGVRAAVLRGIGRRL